MTDLMLIGEEKKGSGTGSARALRSEGKIPAVIYGFNERGKLLGKYLLSLGHNNITFVDNFYGEINGGSKLTDFNIISFEYLIPCHNACFILAMSSHHWKSVTTQILIKYPDSEIQKIDRT